MPCRTEDDDYDRIKYHKDVNYRHNYDYQREISGLRTDYNNLFNESNRKIDFLEACLCGVINNSDNVDNLLNSLDYKEMGVNKEELKQWWKNHLEKDAERKQNEVKQQKRKQELELQEALKTISVKELIEIVKKSKLSKEQEEILLARIKLGKIHD